MSAIGQRYTVKTIFQYLKVPDIKQPLQPGIIPEKKDQSTQVVESMVRPGSNGDRIDQYLTKIPKWIESNPPGKKPLPPEIFDLAYTNNSRNLLQFFSGAYQLVDPAGTTLMEGHFFAIPGEWKRGRGINAIGEDGKPKYYSADGKLLFDGLFKFVEETWDGFFIFYDGKKAGVADREGKILLPAKYDLVHPFRFNNKAWFSVRDGSNNYVLESGDLNPAMMTAYFDVPGVVGERNWVMNGNAFDMVSREQLFTSVKQPIKRPNKGNTAFYIEEKYETAIITREGKLQKASEIREVFFNNKGQLLLGQPILGTQDFNDSLWVGQVSRGDTVLNGINYILKSYGVFNTDCQWRLQPIYRLLLVMDSSHLKFITGSHDRPGLMDLKGNILIPEGRYKYIGKGGKPGKYICVTDTASFLFDAATKVFSAFDRPYYEISNKIAEETGWLEGITKKNQYFLLDGSYRLADTTAFERISYDIGGMSSPHLIKGYPYTGERVGYGGNFYLYTPSLERVRVNFTGKTYDKFSDVDSIVPKGYLFKTADRKLIAQINPGEYFSTACTYLRYDPHFDWLIGENNDRRWGVISLKGDTIVPFVFSRIETYSPRYGTSSLEYGGNKQQLDENGKLLFNGDYETVKPLSYDLFIVAKSGQRGLLHRDGREAIPVKYGYVEFKNGLLWYGSNFGDAKSATLFSLK